MPSNAGEVSADTVRERVAQCPAPDASAPAPLDDQRPHEERADDRPAHRALIRRAGAEGHGAAQERRRPAARSGERQDRRHRPQCQDRADHGRRQRAAQSALSRLALGGPGRRARRGPAGLRHRAPPTTASSRCSSGASRSSIRQLADLSGEPVHRDDAAGAPRPSCSATSPQGKVDPLRLSARFTGDFTAAHYRRASRRHLSRRLRPGLRRRQARRRCLEPTGQKGRTFFEEGSDEVVGTVDARGRPHLRGRASSSPPSEFATLGLAAFALRHRPAARRRGHCRGRRRRARRRYRARLHRPQWRMGHRRQRPSRHRPARPAGRTGSAVAAANPRTIVVLQTGGPVEMPWLDEVAGVLQAWYPGQEAGNAIADVLTGARRARRPPAAELSGALDRQSRRRSRTARSIPASTARCATRKACSSATATTTGRHRRRCSPSASASATPASR